MSESEGERNETSLLIPDASASTNSIWVTSNSLENFDSPTRVTCVVWTFFGFSILAVVGIFLLGVFVTSTPWLGFFAISSCVPGIFILWLVYWRNNKHDAQLSRVVTFIILGMLTVVPLILIEELFTFAFGLANKRMKEKIPAESDVVISSFVSSFLIAAFWEETFKFLVAISATTRARDVPYSIMVYSVAGALGMATVENTMYLINTGITGNLAATIVTAVTRALLAVPLHASTGIIIGVDVARNKFRIAERNFFSIMIVPVLLHGSYDFSLFLSSGLIAIDHNAYLNFIMLLSVVLAIVAIIVATYKRRLLLVVVQPTAQPLHQYAV